MILCLKGEKMTKNSQFATFYFDKQDEILIDEVSDYLDHKAKAVLDFFELDVAKDLIPLQIYIIPTKKQLDEEYKKDKNLPQSTKIEDWVIGYFNNKDKKIVYLSLNDYKSTAHVGLMQNYDEALDYYKKTIVHEFVHYANHLYCEKHNCPYTNKYLAEGLAGYLSKQRENLEVKFNFSLKDILGNRACYDGWRLTTKYLVENYPKSFVLELVRDNQMSKKFMQEELFQKAKNKFAPEKLQK